MEQGGGMLQKMELKGVSSKVLAERCQLEELPLAARQIRNTFVCRWSWRVAYESKFHPFCPTE